MSDVEWDPNKVLDAIATEREVEGETVATKEAHAKHILRDNTPFAAYAIAHLVKYGDDKMRFDASRYILDRVLGKIDTAGMSAPNTGTFETMVEKLVEEAGVTDG